MLLTNMNISTVSNVYSWLYVWVALPSSYTDGRGGQIKHHRLLTNWGTEANIVNTAMEWLAHNLQHSINIGIVP